MLPAATQAPLTGEEILLQPGASLNEPVVGSFRPRWDRWRQEGASPTLLRWIRLGVKLPLVQLPALRSMRNLRLTEDQAVWVDGEIQRLLRVGALRELLPYEPAFLSPIGVVPKKNNKFRLIVDMRLLNSYVRPPKFKFQSLRDLATILRPGDYMFTIDFQDGFFHAEVHPSHQHLLGIRWRNRRYAYQGFPFGLNASPWIFTRFVRATTRALMAKGVRCLAYMDDLIVMASSLAEALEKRCVVLKTLADLGWHISLEKSSLDPSQSKEFLGLTVDTAGPEPRFRVPAAKAHALRHDIDRLLRAHSQEGLIPVRRVAAVAGHCCSLTRAVLPAQLLLRNLYRDIKCRRDWSSLIRLSPASVRDLQDWLAGLSTWDGRVATSRPFDAVLDTDASLSGWGAALMDSSATSAGWWRGRTRHINELELKAVLKALRSFQPLLAGKSVLVRCDNVTAVAFINKLGGRNMAMNKTMRKIFAWCSDHQVQLTARHLPGLDNSRADLLSRLYPQHEWSLAGDLFRSLDRRWGPHTIDRMASARNAKLPRFNSRFHEVGAEAVDALTQDWSRDNNWVVPPIALIPKVIALIRRQKAEATVVAPVWEGRPWFRDLMELCVEPPVPIPNLPSSFEWEGPCLPEPTRNPSWRWIACRISGLHAPLAGLHKPWGY